MRLYFMEVRKICSKKIMWIGMVAMLSFFIFQFLFGAVNGIRIYENERWLVGPEAIERNKEIAKEYKGVLSREKAEAIIEKYGFSYFDDETYYVKGNYANTFITSIMTKWRVTGERPTEFGKNDNGSDMGADYLEGDIIFGYAQGWENLREAMIIYILAINILLIIIVSPVFSEEYTLRTVDVVLTTHHGRSKDIWLKIGAALGISTLVYLVGVGSMYGVYLSVFGTEGLEASAYLLVPIKTIRELTIGQFYILYFLMGLVAILLNTAITLAISATFRQGFLTLIAALTAYLLPFMMTEIVLDMLPGSLFNFILRNIFKCLPFWLAYSLQLGAVPWMRVWNVLFVVVIFIGSILFSYRKYRR